MTEPVRLPPTGPWVHLAAFCEKVIQDNRGILSLISIIDRITVPVLPPGVQGNVVAPRIYMVVAFKAGDARGRVALTVERVGPDGIRHPSPNQWPVLFESEDRGHSLILEMATPTELEGVYWFEAKLDGQLMTRLPLRVVHQPAGPPG